MTYKPTTSGSSPKSSANPGATMALAARDHVAPGALVEPLRLRARSSLGWPAALDAPLEHAHRIGESGFIRRLRFRLEMHGVAGRQRCRDASARCLKRGSAQGRVCERRQEPTGCEQRAGKVLRRVLQRSRPHARASGRARSRRAPARKSTSIRRGPSPSCRTRRFAPRTAGPPHRGIGSVASVRDCRPRQGYETNSK